MFDWKSESVLLQSNLLENSMARGIIVGTSIATHIGWRPIEAVCRGDQILTFKNGFQTVETMHRVLIWHGRDECPEHLRPIAINAGVLNNSQPVKVLPEQKVADERGILCPRDLLARGIASATKPIAAIESVILEFANDEVIYDQVGLHYAMPRSKPAGS